MIKFTIQDLIKAKNSKDFARGETTNDEKGIYMTDYRKGNKLKWIAKKGDIEDFAIYVGWEEDTYEYILSNGNKIYDLKNIKKILNCDEEVLKHYRL